MKSKTAILIFAQSAQKEATTKSFKNAAQVFTQLNDHTRAIVQKSKLPYYRATEVHQVGTTFGERITHAIQSIYDKGYDNVITIGNDTPHLQTHHILKAATQLENSHLILGPSQDGGFYLIGMHKSQFDPLQFTQLPWQTETLSEELLSISPETKNAVLLPVLSDIDTAFDIEIVLQKKQTITNHALLQALYTVITTATTLRSELAHFTSDIIQSSFYNKGSPSLQLY